MATISVTPGHLAKLNRIGFNRAFAIVTHPIATVARQQCRFPKNEHAPKAADHVSAAGAVA